MSIRRASRAAFPALVLATIFGPTPDALGDEAPIGRGVGQRVGDFTLKDAVTGRSVRLYGYRGKKAVVLVFTGVDCPVGNLYMPRLAELADAYKDKGVAFVAINANAHESAEQVAQHAKEYHASFPILKDERNVIADQLLVERTCEALVLDGAARLRYRGSIDDQYGLGTRRDRPGKTYLVDVLDALLAGKPVETTATSVVGCPIDRVEVKLADNKRPRIRPAPAEVVAALKEKEAREPVEVGKVTYAADVAPILMEKCQACHRPKQAAPFALLTYDDARRWAASIREVVDDRRMPPWHADPRFGHFENDRSLSPRQRATLLAWVDQGAPLGDPKDLPAPKTWADGWSVGEPDAVFTIPEQTVAAQGEVAYQYFRVPTNFTEDKWVQSIEARPGDRSVVHHIIVFLDRGDGRRDGGEHLGGYAPGDMPSIYPPGTAKLIPAGANLIFQVHYTPNGKVRTDRSSAGFIFAKAPPTRRAITHGIANNRLRIPPRESNQAVDSHWTTRRDVQLLSFMPHMHLRGKDFRYTVAFPDGREEVLLSVPAYDFAWQSYYRLARPLDLPTGTRVDCLAHFDNSPGNPYNPNPDEEVRWGDQTREEMMIGYVDYTVPISPSDAPKTSRADAPTPAPRSTLLRDLTRLGRRLQAAGPSKPTTAAKSP
jgi:peroxiredoxin